MSTATETIESLVKQEYKYGFVTDVESESVPPGLNEDVIRLISMRKKEPTWLTDWRVQDGTLTLSGFSTNATDLVSIFDQSRFFQSAHLGAPITTEATTGREQFSRGCHRGYHFWFDRHG